MAENDEQDVMDPLPGDDEPTAAEVSSSGGQTRGGLSRLWKLLAVLVVVSGLGAAGLAYLLSGRGEGSATQPEAKLAEDSGPQISLSRIRQIRLRRSMMRIDSLTRSSHNKYLTTEIEENALSEIADRSDLIVVAGILNNYVETLAVLFEMGRIITNNYLVRQSEVKNIFENELMPKYRYAERRRSQLRSRIKNKKFLPFMDNLDYIALHDSVAVYSMAAYLKDGKESDFVHSLEFAYQAKMMKKEFWSQFEYYLKRYQIGFVRNEKVWRRYFGTWDQVEP